MPRKSKIASLAVTQAAPGGTAAVDRALTLLAAFRHGEESLSLQDLADRTLQHKSTVLRLLASLQHAELVLRTDQGRYRLGPGIPRLYGVYASSFSLEQVVMPQLRELVARTGESAAFHVRQGDARLCLYRVDSPQPVRDHIRVGDLLPLDRGAGGRVLQAFSGMRGELYDQVRREGVLVLKADRVPELAGISAPCFEADGRLAGAVTLTMPGERLDADHKQWVIATAQAITHALGGPVRGPHMCGSGPSDQAPEDAH